MSEMTVHFLQGVLDVWPSALRIGVATVFDMAANCVKTFERVWSF